MLAVAVAITTHLRTKRQSRVGEMAVVQEMATALVAVVPPIFVVVSPLPMLHLPIMWQH